MTAKATSGVEIEIKLRLGSFMDYLKLTGHLSPIDEEIRHINCFFDSADRRLSKGGWALRVRVENDRGLITIKSIPSQMGAAVVREEIEAEIPRALAIDIMKLQHDILAIDVPPVQFIKAEFPDLNLVKLIEFENVRLCKRYMIEGRTYTLEIDKTVFSDKSVEYELEVEFEDISQVDRVEREIRKLFASLDIPFQRENDSKFHRALAKAGLL